MTDEASEAGEHRQLLNLCCRYLADPRQLLERTAEIYATQPPQSYDVLELVDGRVFERFSQIHTAKAIAPVVSGTFGILRRAGMPKMQRGKAMSALASWRR